MQATEDSTVTFKVKWVVYVIWTLLTVGGAFGGWALRGAYRQGSSDGSSLKTIQDLLASQQAEGSELKAFQQRENAEMEEMRIEIEWLIRHSPDAKDAPLDDDPIPSPHSQIFLPPMDSAIAPNEAIIPPLSPTQ